MGKKQEYKGFWANVKPVLARDKKEKRILAMEDQWQKKHRRWHNTRLSNYYERMSQIWRRKPPKQVCPKCYASIGVSVHCGYCTVTLPWTAKIPPKDKKHQWEKLFDIYPKFAEDMRNPVLWVPEEE